MAKCGGWGVFCALVAEKVSFPSKSFIALCVIILNLWDLSLTFLVTFGFYILGFLKLGKTYVTVTCFGSVVVLSEQLKLL